MKDLIERIIKEYEFVGETFDKKGKLIGNYCNYSITLQLSLTEIDNLKEVFPLFNFHNLYSNYYLIGFNKK